MNDKIQSSPRAVFLDAGEYISKRFHFGNPALKALKSNAEKGFIRLLSTQITDREIYHHIEGQLAGGLRILEKASSSLAPLRDSGNEVFFFLNGKFSDRIIFDRVHSMYSSFFEACNGLIIDSYSVSVEKIFEDYFQIHPPFNEGKKRKEFPDAFVLKSLSDWSRKNNQKTVVVSPDPDFERFCKKSDHLVYFPSAEAYLNFLMVGENFANLKTLEIFNSNKAAVESKIQDVIYEEFADRQFTVEGEHDSEIEHVSVSLVNFLDWYFLEVTESKIDAEVEFEVEFQGTYRYGNWIGYGPNEDDYSYEYEDGTFTDTQCFVAAIQFTIGETPNRWELKSVALPPSAETVEISKDSFW